VLITTIDFLTELLLKSQSSLLLNLNSDLLNALFECLIIGGWGSSSAAGKLSL
jgi:hypothetical protein